MKYLGDFVGTETIPVKFSTHAAAGGNVAPLSAFEAADIRIYKDGSDTQRTSSNGVAMTSPFDGLTGFHQVTIDLTDNSDAGFFAAGHEYSVVLAPDTETVDGQTITGVEVATFSIKNRAPLRPATAGRDLVVSAGGVADAQVKDIDAGVVDVVAAPHLDADISSRLASAGYTAPLDAAGTRAAVGLAGANLDVQLAAIAGFLDTEIAAILAAVDTEVAAIKLKTDALPADPADASDVAASIAAVQAVVDWFKKVQRGRKYYVNVAGLERLHVVDPDLADDGLEPTVIGTLLLNQPVLDKDGLQPVHQGTGVAKIGTSAV